MRHGEMEGHLAERVMHQARTSFTRTIIVARLTFREAARRKILWAALILGLVFLALYGWGLHALIREARIFSEPNRLVRFQVLNVPLMMGLYAVNYLTVLMTVFTSVDTIAGEISSGTIQALASKPIRRRDIVLGKWLGFVGMLTLYIGFMAGGVIGVTFLLSGYTPPRMIRGIGLIWLEGLLLLSVTFFWGTMFSTLTTGVFTLGLQGIAFMGGWIEQFGAMTGRATAVRIGVIASVIMPSESIWRRAAYEMQSTLVRALDMPPFSSASLPSGIMIVYAAVYLLAGLSLAVWRFGRRDL